MKHGEARFLSCMSVLSLTLMTALAFHGMAEAETVSGETPKQQVIIIDAGHGGPDGGASGADGTRESDLNLSIALKTDAVLGLLGEETLLIRDSDRDISDDTAVSISQKKVSDLKNRVKIVNAHENSLLISIHCNTYPESKYRGAQVFYNAAGNSRAIAESIFLGIQHIDPNNHRQVKTVSPDIYLFRHVEKPGILVECGFLSNPEELALLKYEAYQNKLAIAIGVALTNQIHTDSDHI